MQKNPKQPSNNKKQQENVQSEKDQKLQQIQEQMEQRMQSMDQIVKKQQISSVETRALNIVFDRICRAQEYYNHDDSIRHNSDDDIDQIANQDDKKGSKKGKKGSKKERNVMSSKYSTMTQQKKTGFLGKVVTEKHFTYNELKIVLNELQYFPSNESIREMIWDVDEDNTGCITKSKFELMYKRCRFDTTNLEPRSLYNVVQYLMFLYNSSGNRSDDQELEEKSKDDKIMITFENTLEIFYVIYGRGLIEDYTKLLFGEDNGNGYNSGINEKQISLQEYLKIMKKHDVETRNKDKVSKKNKYLQPPADDMDAF